MALVGVVRVANVASDPVPGEADQGWRKRERSGFKQAQKPRQLDPNAAVFEAVARQTWERRQAKKVFFAREMLPGKTEEMGRDPGSVLRSRACW